MKTLTPLLAGLAALSIAGAAEARCSQYGKVRSVSSEGERFEIDFVNRRSEPVDIYWIDYEGGLRLVEQLGPKARVPHYSYPTHPFVILTADGRCRGLEVIRRPGDRVVAR